VTRPARRRQPVFGAITPHPWRSSKLRWLRGCADLADRQGLRQAARDWRHRIDIHAAKANHPLA